MSEIIAKKHRTPGNNFQAAYVTFQRNELRHNNQTKHSYRNAYITARESGQW